MEWPPSDPKWLYLYPGRHGAAERYRYIIFDMRSTFFGSRCKCLHHLWAVAAWFGVFSPIFHLALNRTYSCCMQRKALLISTENQQRAGSSREEISGKDPRSRWARWRSLQRHAAIDVQPAAPILLFLTEATAAAEKNIHWKAMKTLPLQQDSSEVRRLFLQIELSQLTIGRACGGKERKKAQRQEPLLPEGPAYCRCTRLQGYKLRNGLRHKSNSFNLIKCEQKNADKECSMGTMESFSQPMICIDFAILKKKTAVFCMWRTQATRPVEKRRAEVDSTCLPLRLAPDSCRWRAGQRSAKAHRLRLNSYPFYQEVTHLVTFPETKSQRPLSSAAKKFLLAAHIRRSL